LKIYQFAIIHHASHGRTLLSFQGNWQTSGQDLKDFQPNTTHPTPHHSKSKKTTLVGLVVHINKLEFKNYLPVYDNSLGTSHQQVS
jgi:hypothetical protein